MQPLSKRVGNIGFLGFGNMNRIIATKLLQGLGAKQMFASTRGPKGGEAAKNLGLAVCSNEELLEHCDWVVLGVKPQDMSECLEPLKGTFGSRHRVLSLLAGVSLEQVSAFVHPHTRVVRVMPNVCLSTTAGLLGVAMPTGSSEHFKEAVQDFLSSLGRVVFLEEGEKFDAFCVACCCGPGFVYEFMQVWVEFLEGHGFEPQEAAHLVGDTFKGSALLMEGGASLEALQKRVASKKGTTEAGLKSMRREDLHRVLAVSFEKSLMHLERN